MDFYSYNLYFCPFRISLSHDLTTYNSFWGPRNFILLLKNTFYFDQNELYVVKTSNKFIKSSKVNQFGHSDSERNSPIQ